MPPTSLTLIPAAQWQKETTVLFGIRSAALKKVDAALAEHEKRNLPSTFAAVATAFDEWKRSEAKGVLGNFRNRVGTFDLLERLLAQGGGDDDAAYSGGPAAFQASARNARLGVLYLFGNCRLAEDGVAGIAIDGILNQAGKLIGVGAAAGSAAAGIAGNVYDQGRLAGGQLVGAAREAGKKTATPPPIGQPVILTPKHAATGAGAPPSLVERIEKTVRSLVERITRYIGEKWNDLEFFGKVMEQMRATIQTLVNFLASSAAPFLSGGMDVVAGLVALSDAAFVRFRQWWTGRGVMLAPGHPSAVVAGIKSAIDMSMFKGLAQMVKGSGSLVAAGFSGGASVIGDILLDCAVTIAKMIYRMYQALRLERFLGEAREHWRLCREGHPGIVDRPGAFARWYTPYATSLSLIAILTLNSNICGDKMVYLSMFASDGELRGIGLSDTEVDRAMVAQHGEAFAGAIRHFQAGTRMLDDLKGWGAEYMGSCGLTLVSEANEAQAPETGGAAGPQQRSSFHEGLLALAASHASQRNHVWGRVKATVGA